MSRLASILCAIDFSEHAERALRHAAALAAHTGARLTLGTVNDPLLEAAARAARQAEALHEQTQRELSALLARVWPAGPPAGAAPVVISVGVGAPADLILATAAECSADLIVLGTQGLGAARRMFFGSTAERVLRHTPTPVLAVPAYAPERMTLSAEGPHLSVHRVLAAFDVTDADQRPAAQAAAWARMTGATLLLLHVLPPLPVRAGWADVLAGRRIDERAAVVDALDRLARRVEDGPQVEVEAREGKTSETIVHAANERACGLIVMGVGRAAHRPGATAARVLSTADCPVLVVPRP
ncbi:MAG: universal stress protein [Vicinamibacterales bacterium]|nr:universal stress protein [Vicinamibacterales bacterium]